jgi:hypothetical protein
MENNKVKLFAYKKTGLLHCVRVGVVEPRRWGRYVLDIQRYLINMRQNCTALIAEADDIYATRLEFHLYATRQDISRRVRSSPGMPELASLLAGTDCIQQADLLCQHVSQNDFEMHARRHNCNGEAYTGPRLGLPSKSVL